jgi:hypothetical protein
MGPTLLIGQSSGRAEIGEGPATTFSGHAAVVNAEALGTRTVLSDSGLAPANGGALEASMITANVPGLLTAEVLHASVVAQGNCSRSEASIADVVFSVPGVLDLKAGLVMARACAECNRGTPSARGESEIASLTINDTAIATSSQPNQKVTLRNADVLINEQLITGTEEITVNALRIIVEDPIKPGHRQLEVVIASAHADIHCGRFEPESGDFVTGGGWITGTPSGARGTFSVAGGLKDKGHWGHLSYIDHGSGMQVEGTGVTSYKIINATTRHITGTCEINHQTGFTYRAIVADDGEPGCNDVFSIMISNGYSAGDNLAGGNIQLHKPASGK